MDWQALGDELEEIGRTPDLSYRMGEYRRLLGDLSPGQEGWSEVSMCLAEDLRADGQIDQARATYQQAIDDGGRTVLDPRVGLLDVELDAGDDARVDELLAELLASSRADELVVGDYEWIAESLEEAGRLRQALRWFTIPLRDFQPADMELMPIVALNGRWRVRRALELPVDAFDDAHDVWHEVHDAQV